MAIITPDNKYVVKDDSGACTLGFIYLSSDGYHFFSSTRLLPNIMKDDLINILEQLTVLDKEIG